jgi:TolA-binding protein
MNPTSDDKPTCVVSRESFDDSRILREETKGDETVVMTADRPADPLARKAQVIPAEGAETEEVGTRVWHTPSPLQARVLAQHLKRRLGAITPRHIIFTCLLLIALSIAVVSLIVPKAEAMPEARAEPPTAAIPNADSPAKPTTRSVVEMLKPKLPELPPTPLVPIDDGVTLGAAADALLAGRFDEAAALYRRLAERYPDNPSHAMASEILSSVSDKGAP